jgi:hypothetical protein
LGIGDWVLGIGDWVLGIGDWGIGVLGYSSVEKHTLILLYQ